MASYLSTGMKRKELELDHLQNDVFDFTLSSPACKIRRLDADLPPFIEHKDPDRPLSLEQQPYSEFCSSDDGKSRLRGVVIEELLPEEENPERAIVLFNPINSPLLHSPSNFVVDSNLLSSFKDQVVWEMNSKSTRFGEEEKSQGDEQQLAVIPWVPSQQSHQVKAPEVSEMEVSEPMDVEEMGATMEAEENVVNTGVQSTKELNQLNWSSQSTMHCMFPQPPQNTSTPLVWYR